MTITLEPLDQLRARIDGTVALPGDPDYARCVPWNLAAVTEPGLVVFVRSSGDVAETLRYARAVGATVAVAATGHGALPLGPQTILVHTGEMCDVQVDPASRVARIGAGARWQHVLDAATPHGLAPLGGSSPSAAFSGELVPQDPNDEPASVLLERIKAERVAQEVTKKPRQRSNA